LNIACLLLDGRQRCLTPQLHRALRLGEWLRPSERLHFVLADIL
jgi:hypothetical protein